MALTIINGWLAGGRALDLAAEIKRRADAAGAPPTVTALPSRPRAAYDRVVDALNRLPKPVAVVGTLGLLGAALAAPEWFVGRMEALSRMPEGLWWLIGAVLSLHFGSRLQAHAQAHEREIVEAVAAAAPPPVPVEAESPAVAAPGPDASLRLDTLATGPNAALAEWQAARP